MRKCAANAARLANKQRIRAACACKIAFADVGGLAFQEPRILDAAGSVAANVTVAAQIEWQQDTLHIAPSRTAADLFVRLASSWTDLGVAEVRRSDFLRCVYISRMKKSFLLVGFTVGLALSAAFAATPSFEKADPFLWLEQAHGERAMRWVRAENLKTDAVLERDPRFKPLFGDAKVILEAKDRIPQPSIIAGRIFNFWQDADHTHGIWRQTSQADFQNAAPNWQTTIDLDALSNSEKANWFWKGATCREPDEQRCIISLSDGGEDAVTLREFDLARSAFVDGGFSLPSGKQDFAWQDADTLLLSREWKPGEMTRSGYPFVVKRLKRGQSLDAAVEVFRGSMEDVGVTPVTLNDGAGHGVTLLERAVSIFEVEVYLMGPKGPAKLALPMKSELLALLDGRLIVSLQEDWKLSGQRKLPQGSLVSLDLAALNRDAAHIDPVLIYAPAAREALVEAGATRGHLLVHTLDNVNGRAYSYTPEQENRWSRRQLALPNNISVNLIDTDLHSEQAFVQVTGFLTPPSLMLADLGSGTLTSVKTLPPKFDASHEVAEQFEATSKDGTKIPYFVVHPAAMKMDGSTPTILYAYGGFLDALTPTYSGEMGKLWLERGGAYVLANIRAAASLDRPGTRRGSKLTANSFTMISPRSARISLPEGSRVPRIWESWAAPTAAC